MAYYEYLRDLIAPLGIYSDNDIYGISELEVLGDRFDTLEDKLLNLEREAVVTSAVNTGLNIYETLLSIKDVEDEEELRREMISAMMCVRSKNCSCEHLADILSRCGVRCSISEAAEPFTVDIEFCDVRGVPANMDAQKKIIEMIMPCHLDITYKYIYILWNEFESAFSSWSELESGIQSWAELEIYEEVGT